ncbi:Calcium-binding mitochondrial carrier protein SCaMC-2 [Linum perenne]
MFVKEALLAVKCLDLLRLFNGNDELPSHLLESYDGGGLHYDYDNPDLVGQLSTLLEEGYESLQSVVTFGGVNFDPLFTKFVMYPLAGSILVVPFVETVVAPLSRLVILDQPKRRQIDEVFQQHGGYYRVIFTFDLHEWKVVHDKVGKILEEQGGYKGLWDGNSISILHSLAFYGTNFLAYFGIKYLLKMFMGPMSLNLVTATICGGLSTLIATYVSHPLDTLKTRVQAQVHARRNRVGAREIYNQLCRDGEFDSLYAGLLPSLLGNIQSMGLNLVLFESLTKVYRGIRPTDSRFLTTFVCSSLSGLAASIATHPMEVVKRKMQMEGIVEESNNLEAIREKYEQIVEQDGAYGLYRGIHPHSLKVVVGHVVTFVTYEIVRIPCCLATMGLGLMFGVYD